MRIGLHRESGHVDLVAFRSDGTVGCTWCDDDPTHRAQWPGYRWGELVCSSDADRLDGYGASVTPRHTLSSFQAERTA